MRLLAAMALSLSLSRAAVAADLGVVPPAEITGSRAVAPQLRVGGSAAALITAGALTLWGASALERSRDDVRGCRWCEPGGFDRWSRDRLRWADPHAASEASDVLLLGVPIASTAAVAWLSWRHGTRVELLEDLSLLAASLLVTDSLTAGVKHASARLRPGPWASGGPRVDGDLHSFFSGHTSRVFAAAAAATQIARLRGRPGWRWLALVSFTAASATGWLRVGADQHWATDVLAAAAVGTAVGWSIPALALGPATRDPAAPRLVPAPGGLALVF